MFEIIGSKEKAVAIIEVRNDKEREKEIVKKILSTHKNVKSILRKASIRKGELRLREFEHVYGEENTEVLHKEFGYFLKVDPKKVYFSPREAKERQIIASKVKSNENVLVMFSGIMPFGIAISKKADAKIYGIEINEDAHKYAIENARINKVSHKVIPLLGDVREKCKEFFGKCDRILMPLPFESKNFFEIAIKCLKENGIIHFYSIGNEPKIFENAENFVAKKCNELNIACKILDKRKVQMYAPRKWKICLDLEITKK